MSGSISFDPYSIPDDLTPVPVLVARAARPEGGEGPWSYQALPNVRCLSVQYREGPHPPAARFAYVFQDDDPDLPWPAAVEEVWPLAGASGPGRYRVRSGDRLVVFGYTPSGARRVLFHGFAASPQADVGRGGERVTFSAAGVAVRLWDRPIVGSTFRDGDDPSTPGEPVTCPGVPCHFNPYVAGVLKPNCTPDGADETLEETGDRYPVFLDWRLDPPGENPQTYWDLGKMVRYLSVLYNDESEVLNLDLDHVDDWLRSYAPKNGQILNPKDPATFTKDVILVRDYVAQNRTLPDVLAEWLEYAGFSFRFATDGDENDDPNDYLAVYRKDAFDPRAPKDVYLPARGAIIDFGAANAEELHVARDDAGVHNAVGVETAPIGVEACLVLAPDFVPLAADADAAATPASPFLTTNLAGATAADRAKYRRYVFDEAGDGHFDLPTTGYTTGEGTSLDLLFGPPDPDQGPRYVRRNRPCQQTLYSTDAAHRPYKARLEYSTDYAGVAPAVFDPADPGKGTWHVASGGWRLLDDRIGIQVTTENPEAWTVGEAAAGARQKIQLRGVTAQARPTAQTPRFFLRLTAVVESDIDLGVVADRRPASPLPFTLRRQADARDHFRAELVDPSSPFNATGSTVKARDDTDRAKAHAAALRAAHEFPPVAGSVTIPYVTNAYRVGDRVGKVGGRDVSLRTNAGSGAGEAAAYPTVVAVSYEFGEGEQRTVLELSDRRSEPVGVGRA